MKTYLTLFWIIVCVVSGTFVLAQPLNDDCSGAIHLDIASSEATAIKTSGDTRNTIDEKDANIPVCSGNFYRDAVWYSFIAPDTVPPQGISIKLYVDDLVDDIDIPGVALYESCDTGLINQPIYCKNDPDQSRVFLGRYCPDLTPGKVYYLRVWSAKGTATDWTEGWGTFRIAAFVNEPLVDTLDIIWDGGGFNGGLNGWTVEAIRCGKDNNQNQVDSTYALWTWAIGGLTKGNLWKGQTIGSETGCLGAMVFDSDFMNNGGKEGNNGNGPCPSDQEGTLTSPWIDLSGVNTTALYLWFYQYCNDFQSGFFVEYTVDDLTWNSIEVNLDPPIVEFPLPEPPIHGPARVWLPGAETADSIRLRFRIIANYYFWIIDDVRLIRPPCTDLAMSDTITVVPNKIWHQDQLHEIPVAATIQNLGLCSQEGAMLVIDVMNKNTGDSIFYSQSFIVPDLPPSTKSLFPLGCWDMPSLPPANNYFFQYTLVPALPDAFPENNSFRSKPFSIDERLMAKDNVATYELEPGSADFTICNAYFIPKGKPYSVCEFQVGIGNAGQHLPSVFGLEEGFFIELYEGADVNQDGTVDLNAEVVLVGQGYHLFQEEDKSKTIFNVALTDSTGLNCVALSDSTDYLAVVKYVPPNGQHYPLELLVQREPGFSLNRAVTYSEVNGGLGLCRPLPTTFLTTQKDGQLLNADYGESYGVPMIRLALDEVSPVKELLPLSGVFSIHPNPVQDIITVHMDYGNNLENGIICISNLTGKTMMNQLLSSVNDSTWTYNVSNYPNGTYFISFTTLRGVYTEKFVIQH